MGLYWFGNDPGGRMKKTQTQNDPQTDRRNPPRKRKAALLAPWGAGLAVVCFVAAILSGFGYRLGWWSLGPAFHILSWSVSGAAVAFVLSLAGLMAGLNRSSAFLTVGLVGLVLAGATFGFPLREFIRARSVPAIHDITTDTVDPPQFHAILALRAKAPNSPVYGGKKVADQQIKAYPGIKPAFFEAPEDVVFKKALEAARSMGWHIDAADPAAGRIEATATTFWFGFKDDVVVRVKTLNDGRCRVDVRSESRIGLSDLGTNARRITYYLYRLASLVQSAPAR